jgi:hypothetical protein
MADLRAWFRKNVTHVKEDADKSSVQLVQRLKQMTPAEFLRLPPNTFASLTAAQYRDIVATIAPDTKLPEPPPLEELPADIRTWGDWWRERSTLIQLSIVTMAITVIAVGIAIAVPTAWKWTVSRMEIVRPVSTATWPVCARLSAYTDGCVYYPTQNLTWAWVAQQLAIPPQELYEANQHLPPQYIPVNSMLVVWRHRGRLEN